ncbi:hypothetical protein GGD66_007081 [Bradyrhizobium sp. CIR48]|nr:hypothetical protein [Bradyrhizobium sp. CIR48]
MHGAERSQGGVVPIRQLSDRCNPEEPVARMERSVTRGRSPGIWHRPGLRWRSIRATRHRPVSPSVNPEMQKYSTLPKFGFGVCVAHPDPAKGAVVRRHEPRIGERWTRSVVHERREQGGINPVRSRLRADERRLKRTAKSRGPGCRCYSQALRRCAEPDRAKRAAIREVTEASRNSSPGRARHRPSNIAQGRPDVSASPVDPLCIACASHRTTDPRVPAGARPSLRPFVEGAMRSAKLGRNRREEVKTCLQHTTGVVGWAKRLVRHSSKSDGGSVPTPLVPRLNLVGTARCAFAYLRHRVCRIHSV